MHQQVERQAAERPAWVAVREYTGGQWRTTNWDRLREMVAGVAERAGRFGDGDAIVVLVLDNSAESIAMFLGLTMASVDVLCVEANSSHLGDDRSVLRRIGASQVIGPDFPTVAGTTMAYSELLGETSSFVESLRVPDRDPAILALTSGSTGEPRIVRQTLSSIERGGQIYRAVYRYTDDDKVLGPIPLAHSFGMMGLLAGALAVGAEIMTMPRFSVSGVRSGISQGATVLLGTPMIYRILSMAPQPAAGEVVRLRTLLSSGGPLASDTRLRAEGALGLPIRQIYGSTEAGLIACQYDRDTPWPLDSAGSLHSSVEWRVEPSDSSVDPCTGRFFIRTSTMFSGYVGGGEAALGNDGMYDTGDLVHVDPGGDLTVLARKNTFVNVGGRKVAPGRVEAVLNEHPNVADAHVFGHEHGGEETVHAAVVLHDPHTDVADILAYCRRKLANYEVPYRVHVLRVLPRTTMGKVDHSALARACAALPSWTG